MESGTLFQGAKAELQDQDLPGNQRKRGAHANLDSVDCDAGFEVLAIEVDIRMVSVQSCGFATASTVCLSRPARLAKRTFRSAARLGRNLRRAACLKSGSVELDSQLIDSLAVRIQVTRISR